MIRNFSKFISPLLVLALVFCLASGVSARIADTAALKLVDSDGAEVDLTATEFSYGDTYYFIGEGLVPNQDYVIKSNTTTIESVTTDANGFFVEKHTIIDLASDDDDALTFTLYVDGESTAIDSVGPITYAPSVTLGKTSYYVTETWDTGDANDNYPVSITVHGFSSEADLTATLGDETVDFLVGSVNDDANENTTDDTVTLDDDGAFNVDVYFQVPEMAGGTYTLTVTDGTKEVEKSFTINPMIFFNYDLRETGDANEDVNDSGFYGREDGYVASTCGLTSLSQNIGDGNNDSAINLGAANGRAGCIPVYGNYNGTMYDNMTITTNPDSFKWLVISGTGFSASTSISSLKIGGKTLNVDDAANDADWEVSTSSSGSFGIDGSSSNLPIVIDTAIDLGVDFGIGPKDVVVKDNTFSKAIILTGEDTTAYPTIYSYTTSGEVGDDLTLYYHDYNTVSAGDIKDDATAISVLLFPNGSSSAFSNIDVNDLVDGTVDGLNGVGLVAANDDLPFLGGSFEITIPDVRNEFESGSPKSLAIKAVAMKTGNGTNSTDDNVAFGIDDVSFTLNPSLTFYSFDDTNDAFNNLSASNELSELSYNNGDMLYIDVHGFAASSTEGEQISVTLNGSTYQYYHCDATDDDGTDNDTAKGTAAYTSPWDGTLSNDSDDTTGANDIACIAIEVGKPGSSEKASTKLPAGTYDLVVASETTGSSVTDSLVIEPQSDSVSVSSYVYNVYLAPTDNLAGDTNDAYGLNSQKVSNTTTTHIINGATINFNSLTGSTGGLSASTPYLVVVGNYWDAANAYVAGKFTSTANGLVPTQTKVKLPMTLLPGANMIYIAEDVDADGVFTFGTDTITDVSLSSLEVFGHMTANTIRAGAGDPVTFYGYGMLPSNYPDTDVDTEFRLTYDASEDSTSATGISDDDAVIKENIEANVDGQFEVSAVLPQIEGETTSDILLLEQLDDAAVTSIGDTAGASTGIVGYNVERKIKLTLSSTVGNSGDAIYVSGDGLKALTTYTLTFGGAGTQDAGNIPQGKAVVQFNTTNEGKIPEGTFFIVPAANNPTFGVVVTPTPAANLIDLQEGYEAGNVSVLDASERPEFVVGGTVAELVSVESTGTTSVVVTFSDSMNPTDAADVSNYIISTADGTSLPITKATVSGAVVTLSTNAQSDVEYTFTATSVKDALGSEVSASATFMGTATGLALSTASLDLTVDGDAKTFTVSLEGYTGLFTVSSSDDTVATAAIDGDTVTVTPVAEGSATITVTDDPNNDYEATVTVSVTTSGGPDEPVDTPDEPIENGGNGADLSSDSTGAKFSPGTVVDGQLTGNIQWSVNIPEYNAPVSVWILVFGPGEEGVTFGNANLINSAGEFISDSQGYPKYAENQTGPFVATIGDSFDPCDTALAGEDKVNVRYGVYYLIVDQTIVDGINGTDADQLLAILGQGMSAELEYIWFNAVCE